MKRKLLLLLLPLALFTSNGNAQDHVWNFSDASWTGFTGYNSNTPPTTTIDGLTFISGGSAVGNVSSSAATYSDGFVSTSAADIAGVTLSGVIPTKRGISFPVSGPCTVKVWAIASSTNRTITVSDGTTVVGSISLGASPYKAILEITYAGTAGTLYLYCNNTAKIAKIAVSNSLSTDDFEAENATNIYASGNRVYVSNVKSNTTVSIYSISGALIKTITAESDTDFELESGVWIAKTKSQEGEKSVKLLVK